MKDKVFISYAHEDAEIVWQIAGLIRQTGTVEVWDDRKIRGGREFFEVIAEHLVQSEWFIFMASSRSEKSPWCLRELELAISEEKKILAIYLEDVKLSPRVRLSIQNTQCLNYYGRSIQEFQKDIRRTFQEDTEYVRPKMDETQEKLHLVPVEWANENALEDGEATGVGFVHPDYENIRAMEKTDGATGDLFLAHKKGMNVDVVIKRTQTDFQKDLDQENESTILKNLKHRYLPRIYDVIYGRDGCVYTVMERIKGKNLREYLAEHGRPATQKECYRWACQLCEVVQYLHEENCERPKVIHCDIKPGNVMITESGDICLIDFNTSLILGKDKGAVAHTDGYAAPEQYDEKYGPISEATDVYAMGATLYFAVTGQRPESSVQNVTPLKHYRPKISRAMQEIIVRAMQKQQAWRFQHAEAMLRALKDVDKRDRSYKNYQLQKGAITLALAACFAASAYSCYYGAVRMRSERENGYLLNLAQAEQAEKSADYDTAQTLLEDAIRQQPGRVDGYLQMAALQYRTGEYQAALNQLDSAVSSGNLTEETMSASSVEKLHFIKGNCWLELQEYDKAVQELEIAVQQQDAGTESYRSLAIALANAGRLDEAQKTLETLRKAGASSGDCNLVEAEILSLQKEYSPALELYEKVFDEVTDPQLLSHAYLSAANTALDMGDVGQAEDILQRGCEALPESQAVLQKEMLADLAIQQAVSDKENAETYYARAQELLEDLLEHGYGTISTRLNLATVLQAQDQYDKADEVLTGLIDQYPSDYRFDMQRAYLLIDWQGAKPAEKRDYHEAETCYDSAVEKYRQAQANGTEDAQMTVLKNLIDQLHTSGWL